MLDFQRPLVLRQSKTIGRMLLANGLLMLLAGGVLHWVAPLLGWVVGVVAAAGTLALVLGGLMLRRPAMLTLAPEGLTMSTFVVGKRRTWTWDEVSPFAITRVWAGRPSAEVIGFTSRNPAAPRPEALPTYWGIPVAETLALLNRARAQWCG